MNDAYTGHANSVGATQYSSETVDQEMLGSAGDTTVISSLQWTPVRPASVQITIGGDLVTDNGSGVLVSTNAALLSAAAGANVIDYISGTFRLTLSAPASDEIEGTTDIINDVGTGSC